MASSAPLLFALLIAAPPADAKPTVNHERSGANGYRVHLRVPHAGQLDEGARLMDNTIRSLCGDLHPHYGRWEAVQPLATAAPSSRPPAAELVQEVTCEAEPPAAPPGPAAPVVSPSWADSPADEQAVRQASDAFLDARDAGRFEEAYGFLGAVFRATESIETFTARTREFHRSAGRRLGRRLVAVTWYNNDLPGAPPGLYAAVDFVGEYEKLHFACGYLIWQLQADRSWRLVTANQAVATRAAAGDASAEEIQAVRAQMGCRG